jgi:hypothetical protein
LNNFSVKSIGLYGVAIGSAIGFFHLVTSYGEAHLQAPHAIAGVYAIADAANLPDCLRQPQLAIEIQQSGMYLTGNLTTDSSNPARRPTLSGSFRDRQLQLDGLVSTNICPRAASVRITGTIALDRHLQGRLSIAPEQLGTSTPSTSSTFTATPASTAKALIPAH